MCGISVIIDAKNQRVHETEIRNMNDLIRHRGPDGEDYYFGNHFALGHRMLKITDFSAQGRQPMSYRQYVIVHNGEIYNFKELRETLKKSSYEFHTTSDTEVIMAAYDKWGEDCVNHFVGMWAFVLYDIKKQILFCSRDRFGIKPLFYAQLNHKLLLGSEIKQLKAFDEFIPKINHATAFDFLYNGKIDNISESFFNGVFFLPAGHNLIYKLKTHNFSVVQWYNINNLKGSETSGFKKATETFNELFTESILSHTISKLPVGACLSGGLDSTSILGVTEKLNSAVVTFSSCYTQHGYNEIEYINNAIMHYGFPNHKNYPNVHELIDNKLLKKIVYHQDQPILSGSFFSEYKVFETAAASKIRIILSGQGADEYLGGYGEFALLNLRGLLRKGKLAGFAGAIRDTAAKQNKSITQVLTSFIIFGLNIPYFSKKINKQSKEIVTACLNPKWIDNHTDRHGNALNLSTYKSLSSLSKEALSKYSLPHQLHSEDRNSMLYSIESRLPFLDHRLVEYCLGLPDRFIIRNGATKAVLRESLKSVLPPRIYNRHAKLGFPGPEESLFNSNYEYINKEFRDYIQHLPDIFSPHLTDLHDACYNNKTPYNNILFRALSFGTWAREFGLMENAVKPVKAAALSTKAGF
ncbi:MAG: asparagine synthase (glutamine-hydrolyzing) [Chitinophagaceae bacterium]